MKFLARLRRIESVIIIVGSIVAATVLLVQKSNELTELIKHQDAVLASKVSLTRMLDKAVSDKRRALIQSATMLVDIEPNDPKDFSKLHITERIVYTVIPIKPYKPDENAFEEMFIPSTATIPSHWPGTDDEDQTGEDHEQGVKFAVKFAADVGTYRTIVTGIDYDVDTSKLDEKREVLHGTFASRFQRFSNYNNTFPDFIGELTMVISSRSLPFSDFPQVAYRSDKGKPQAGAALQVEPHEGKQLASGYQTLWYRWENVDENDEVGILYRWK